MFGVIIPAWRCEAAIYRSLGTLAEQRFPPGLEASDVHIVVAVNDGREASRAAVEAHRTALQMRGYRFDVLLTPIGRRAAFQAAEAILSTGPRLYLDQDAKLTPNAIASLYTAIGTSTKALFASSPARFTRSPSALVRAFLRCWTGLPYFSESPVLAGAFAVSAAGRARWQELPALEADDKFVRLQFAPWERVRIDPSFYEVEAPQTYRKLLADRRRYRRMNLELSRTLADRPMRDARRYAGIAQLLFRPSQWRDAVIFAFTCAWVLAGSSSR